MSDPDRQLLVLIGAARSGTKLVRDVLGRQSGVATVPYDVNFLWRIGNERFPHDELTPSDVNWAVKARVRHSFQRWWSSPVLVEKTVGNCLRVPYVQSIFPDAKFVHLIRNGYDVVESAHRQWLAKPDWQYLLRKLHSVPVMSAPAYIARTGRDTIKRRFRRYDDVFPPLWGPAYRGIEDDLAQYGLLATCAWQWRHCVESAILGLKSISANDIIEIRYEEFVHTPGEHIHRLMKFAGVPVTDVVLRDSPIRTDDIGKGRRSMSFDSLKHIESIIQPTNAALGYLD